MRSCASVFLFCLKYICAVLYIRPLSIITNAVILASSIGVTYVLVFGCGSIGVNICLCLGVDVCLCLFYMCKYAHIPLLTF